MKKGIPIINQFLYLIVKNGQIDEVASLSQDALLATAEVVTDGVSALWRVSLTVPPAPHLL